MPLVCPSCGTANPDGGRFCSNCASSLQAVTQPAAVTPPPAAAAPPSWANPPSPTAATQPLPVVPQPQAPAPQAPPPSWAAQPGAAPAPPAAAPAWIPAGPPPPGWGQSAGGPPAAMPPGYPAAYPAYPPVAAPARRRPVGLIVVGAAVVLALLVGGGVAASSILSKPAPSPAIPVFPSPAPSGVAVVPTPQPTPAPSTAPVATATPAASATPRPVVIVTAPPTEIAPSAEPTSGPTAGPTAAPPVNGKEVSVANLSLTAADPWTVDDTKDYLIDLSIPKKGIMTVMSGTIKDATTATAWIQGMLAEDQKTDPNADYCKGSTKPEAVNVPNGPEGVIAAFCYTVTPQGGQALKLVDIAIVGVDGGGKTLYIIDITSTEDNISEVIKAADPVLSSVTWKLYKP
jgi:hypothetical protein